MEIKKCLCLFFFFCLLSAPAVYAQHGPGAKGSDHHEKIQAARVAHISSKLNLSAEQAQKFWPIYNEFSQKREALRSQQRQLMHGMRDKEPSNDEARRALSQHLRMEREEAAIEEEYYGKKLQTVLEARQVVQLMHAEHEFKKMLLQRLKDNKVQ
jgi:Spy/CpxP family protein refolding chaperone